MGSWFSLGGEGEGAALLSFILAVVFKELQEIPEVGLYHPSLIK